MVILSANPYAVPKEELNRLQVQQLYLAGKPYESCREGALKAALRGLVSDGKA